MPNIYSGESLQNIGTADLTGSWKGLTYLKNDFMGNDNTIFAQNITISADKKVSAYLTGDVQMYENGKVRINLTGNAFGGDEDEFIGTFYGYVVAGYDYDNFRPTLFLSATNEYGFSIVAEKAFD